MKRFMDFRVKKIDEADFLSEPSTETPQPEQSAPAEQPTQSQKVSEEKPKSSRQALADKIKPQFEAAKSIVDGVHQAFADNCANTTKYDSMGDQIKNFEKQIRGACQQTISIVEQEKFDWHDWNNCSPKSFKCITLYDDRDMDVLKLCAGIIVFYNSLIGTN
jgi:hypothetical protein